MLAAVSPYHLTSREPPALAALLLAESCVTYLPAPARGPTAESLRESLRSSQPYRVLLDGWSWCEALWRAGVISAGYAGQAADEDIHREARALADGDSLAGLMNPALFDDPRRALDAIARDLLRAGPDPAISIPVLAGLDRFASRHAMVAMRPVPTSVAQRAEARMARQVFALALPILTQADGESILEARRLLAEPLRDLRGALSAMARDAADPGVDPAALAARHREPLADAVRRYAEQFERHAEELTRSAGAERVRVRHGLATLTGVLLPADAVARSSAVALASLSSGSPASPPPPPSADRLLALFVKPL